VLSAPSRTFADLTAFRRSSDWPTAPARSSRDPTLSRGSEIAA
jgi:hypothetical protein